MKPDRHALTGELEKKANTIARSRRRWDPSPRGMIARELTLTLEELAKIKALHHKLDDCFLAVECQLGTAILQAQEPAAKQGMHGQLAALQAEQRRLALAKHERLAVLRQRLLSLLEKHNTLLFDED